jgi:hypothetical protein
LSEIAQKYGIGKQLLRKYATKMGVRDTGSEMDIRKKQHDERVKMALYVCSFVYLF